MIFRKDYFFLRKIVFSHETIHSSACTTPQKIMWKTSKKHVVSHEQIVCFYMKNYKKTSVHHMKTREGQP